MNNSLDSKSNYYNFVHPHRHARSDEFKCRLGNFQTKGGGQKTKPLSVIVLHVPIYDDKDLSDGDQSAEKMARYLANPQENISASVHIFSDRDSYILSLPADTIAYGCGNPHTYQQSLEIEISGDLSCDREYWLSDDGVKKLKVTAYAIWKSIEIAYGKDYVMPPYQQAEFDDKGNVIKPGFCQHRDIPYWSMRESRYYSYPLNLNIGQHADICPDFPYEKLWELIEEAKKSDSILTGYSGKLA